MFTVSKRSHHKFHFTNINTSTSSTAPLASIGEGGLDADRARSGDLNLPLVGFSVDLSVCLPLCWTADLPADQSARCAFATDHHTAALPSLPFDPTKSHHFASVPSVVHMSTLTSLCSSLLLDSLLQLSVCRKLDFLTSFDQTDHPDKMIPG